MRERETREISETREKVSLFSRVSLISRVSRSLIITLLCPLFVGAVQYPRAPTQDFEKLAAQAAQAREANRFDEATALYRQALRLRPRWDEGWFNLATLLYDRDAYAEAAQAFKQATDLNPKVGTAWVMLGLCEFKLGSYDDALKHIQQGRHLGINENPNLRNVMLYHEGLLLLEKGDFETAQKTLGLLSKDGINNEDLIIALGLSALRIPPSKLPSVDSTTRIVLGRAGQAEHFAVQKKFAEALGEYDRLVREFPKVENLQYAYGRLLMTSNEDEKAISAFQREIEISPNHLLARLMIADTKLRLKDPSGGLPYAEEVVKLNPKLPLGHYLLGTLLLETGQTARAITELETAQRLLPEEPRIYFALGRAYARANRKDDAERARATFERLNKRVEQN
jgi:tetratricopeptide (TPR) repeat protein